MAVQGARLAAAAITLVPGAGASAAEPEDDRSATAQLDSRLDEGLERGDRGADPHAWQESESFLR